MPERFVVVVIMCALGTACNTTEKMPTEHNARIATPLVNTEEGGDAPERCPPANRHQRTRYPGSRGASRCR